MVPRLRLGSCSAELPPGGVAPVPTSVALGKVRAEEGATEGDQETWGEPTPGGGLAKECH